MVMTDEEVVRNYRQAKDRKGIIQILADLNATNKNSILDILERAGEIKPMEEQKADKQNPIRRKTGRPPEVVFDEDVARQLYEQGLVDREIAQRLDVTKNAIWKWRNRNNLISQAKKSNTNRTEGSEDMKKITEDNVETSDLLPSPEQEPLAYPILLKIQKILDLVSPTDSAKIAGQYLDLMITMLSDEVQRIVNAE